jgi:hypothetical protein
MYILINYKVLSLLLQQHNTQVTTIIISNKNINYKFLTSYTHTCKKKKKLFFLVWFNRLPKQKLIINYSP